MSIIKLKTLGKFQISYKNRNVTQFSTCFVEELCAFLLIYSNQPHHRLKIIYTIWPDVDEEKGRGRLNTTLWRMKKALATLGLSAEKMLHTTRDWITLQPEHPLEVDIDIIQSLTNNIDWENKKQTNTADIIHIIDLYTGEFLEGFYSPWCLQLREKYERVYLRLLGQLMHRQIANEAYADAVQIGHHILSLDSLREDVHRAIMYCYFQRNQFARVIKQYKICEQLLWKEFKIAPSDGTRELFHQAFMKQITAQAKSLNPHQLPLQDVNQALYNYHQASQNLLSLLEKHKI
ncbi:MAG: hypothetical protein KC421_08825 [Anaerolineales bacterium]|nr:hypothetical protein [Anaerolineales bacterium]